MNQYEFYVGDANEQGMRNVVVADTYGQILARYESILFLPSSIQVPGRQPNLKYSEVMGEMVGYRPDIYPDTPLESWVQSLEPLELFAYINEEVGKEQISGLAKHMVESTLSNV